MRPLHHANPTSHDDGFLPDKKFLSLDNHALFAKGFSNTLEDAGVRILRTACQTPDMFAIAERFVGSVRRRTQGIGAQTTRKPTKCTAPVGTCPKRTAERQLTE